MARHPAQRSDGPRRQRRRMLSESRLRAEIERLQVRIEYHRRHPGPAADAIIATYQEMLLLRRRLLAGDEE